MQSWLDDRRPGNCHGDEPLQNGEEMVVYMFSSFEMLAPESRDLSQAEKEIIVC